MNGKTILGIIVYVALSITLFYIPMESSNEVVATLTVPSPPQEQVEVTLPEVIPEPVSEPEAVIKEPEQTEAPEAPQVPQSKIVEAKLKRGDTFAAILRRLGVEQQDVGSISLAAGKEIDLRRLSIGDTIRVYLNADDDRLEKVELEKLNECVVELNDSPACWQVHKRAITLTTYKFRVIGTIENNFYSSARALGLTASTIMDLADIFAGDIDFLTDFQSGDSFSLIFERLYNQDKFVRDGRILAARIRVNGTKHEAYYFKTANGEDGYYASDGSSLRKAFLRSPLRYTRISSTFTRRRLHPILKIYRPHLGVDYAAPPGTPVSSIGDGKVIFKGWNGGFGRFVKIRHYGGYVTTYGHLNSYANGIEKGSTVKQGQMIGRVGSSGLATGPHLDFRITMNGSFINPLTLSSPAAPPLSKKEIAKFGAGISPLMTVMNSLDKGLLFAAGNGRTRAIP